MPHKSRRKNKQPSHLKVTRSLPPQASASVPAAGPLAATPSPVTATALKLPALKTARGSATVVWSVHVGSEIRRIAIIGGAIFAVMVLASLLF